MISLQKSKEATFGTFTMAIKGKEIVMLNNGCRRPLVAAADPVHSVLKFQSHRQVQHAKHGR